MVLWAAEYRIFDFQNINNISKTKRYVKVRKLK